jgi:hypothetical protein
LTDQEFAASLQLLQQAMTLIMDSSMLQFTFPVVFGFTLILLIFKMSLLMNIKPFLLLHLKCLFAMLLQFPKLQKILKWC